MILLYFLILLQISHVLSEELTSYENHVLYKVVANNYEQLALIRNLSGFEKVNFWRYSDDLYRPIEFTIGPDEHDVFLRIAADLRLNYTTLLSNVQSAFDEQTVQIYTRRRLHSFNWEHFFRVDDIYSWFNDLTSEYPTKCQIMKLGKTSEDRDILALRVRLKPNPRSTVIMEGGIHAREWLSPAVVTYILHSILTAASGSESELKTIAETYEWYFVPVLNPDGYEYSFTRDRMWRKNRRRFHDGKGVDLNSNFGFRFGTLGCSDHATSPRYSGPNEFSERESRFMADLVNSTAETLEYYLAFHSYGQYMVIPYAHTNVHLDNYDEVKQMCEEAAAAIKRRHGTEYSSGLASETIGYYSSGVSVGWVKSRIRVPYVLTIKLRDQGEWGFAIPPTQIRPCCEETLDGVVSFLTPRTKEFSKLQDYSSTFSTQCDMFVILFCYVLYCLVN